MPAVFWCCSQLSRRLHTAYECKLCRWMDRTKVMVPLFFRLALTVLMFWHVMFCREHLLFHAYLHREGRSTPVWPTGGWIKTLIAEVGSTCRFTASDILYVTYVTCGIHTKCQVDVDQKKHWQKMSSPLLVGTPIWSLCITLPRWVSCVQRGVQRNFYHLLFPYWNTSSRLRSILVFWFDSSFIFEQHNNETV